MNLGWAFFIFDELQCLIGQVLGDAFVASLALQASRPSAPLVLVAAVCFLSSGKVCLSSLLPGACFASLSPWPDGGSAPSSPTNA